MQLSPKSHSRRTVRLGSLLVAAITAFWMSACGSEQSVNTQQDGDRLSHASNNISDSGAWSYDGTNMDERWSEDPTVMEPDYPFAGAQPGFGSQAFTSDR